MPSVLRWLSTKLNCSSQVASLLAATASGDVELVRGIIKADPDLGLYNTQGGQGGGRSALTVAAERGDLEILEVIYEGAVKAKGEAFARQFLNAGAERGQTPLMRACVYGTSQHVECVSYLLSRGADPFAETEKGETCLHMAAKNAYTECLSEILSATVSIGGSAPVRLADMTLPYTPPVKFVDMRNAAGFTPLHLATLKNSPAAMQVLLGAGASMDAGISDAGNTPHLAKGSTALHIAAARGSQPCCSVLLDFQTTIPGMELRGIRNQRGLKASQLARLAGHDGLAALLSERQGGSRRARASRRRRRNREALHTQGGGPRAASSPEAVLALLVQRAKLLLALREVGLDLDSRLLHEDELEKVEQLPKLKDNGSGAHDAKDEVAAAVAEFTELWKKGELDVAGKNGGVLSSLIPADMPVAKLPDEILGDSENGEDSYAAAAMVQAALNAMTYFSPVAKPLDLPPTELKPTSPIAAAMVVQAALRRLAGKGASQNSTSAAMLLQSISQAQNRTEDTRGAPAQPSQQAESSHFGTGGRPNVLQTAPLPQAEAREAIQQPAEQVQRILSKARRRQRRNALRSIEVAALEANQGDSVAVESSARSTESLGAPVANPLMDNPLFPTPVDGSMAPGERRRAALRQAALRTAPQACSHSAMGSPCSSSSVPHGSALAASVLLPEPAQERAGPTEPIPTPFANPNMTAGGEEDLPPAFPWELYVGAEGRNPLPDNPFSFSSSMPSRKQVGKAGKGAASGTPQTPTDVSGKLEAFSDGLQSGQASPSRRLRHAGSQEVPRSPASVSESVLSTTSRRIRADASDAPSVVSSMTPVASHLMRTDSLDGTCTSNTPRGTPQASGMLSDDTASEFDREDDSSSDTEAKANLDRNASLKGIDRCAICMDRPLQVGISTCDHKVCYGCAYQLCSRGLSPPICPFCRGAVATFVATSSIDKKGGAAQAL